MEQGPRVGAHEHRAPFTVPHGHEGEGLAPSDQRGYRISWAPE